MLIINSLQVESSGGDKRLQEKKHQIKEGWAAWAGSNVVFLPARMYHNDHQENRGREREREREREKERERKRGGGLEHYAQTGTMSFPSSGKSIAHIYTFIWSKFFRHHTNGRQCPLYIKKISCGLRPMSGHNLTWCWFPKQNLI